MKTDMKITLRISSLELEEIDEFLVRHSDYKNRSDLIREAVVSHMKKVDSNESVDLNAAPVRLNDRVYNTMTDLVELGFFNDLSEALNYILIKASADRFIPKVIQELISSQRETNRAIDLFNEEFPLKRSSYKNRIDKR